MITRGNPWEAVCIAVCGNNIGTVRKESLEIFAPKLMQIKVE